MIDLDETEMDKLAEAAAQPVEERFCQWYLGWLKDEARTDGDVVFQVGAMLQEMYETGYRSAHASLIARLRAAEAVIEAANLSVASKDGGQ